MKVFTFLWMLFMHVLDDFHLQGILANMKQKKWWNEQTSDPKYRCDYLMALAMHSISWSFCVMLPIAVYLGFQCDYGFALWFVLNAAIHGVVDDMKANRHRIDLVEDQAVHLWQIIVTAGIFL